MLYILLVIGTIIFFAMMLCWWISLGKKIKRRRKLRWRFCTIMSIIILAGCIVGISVIPTATYDEKKQTNRYELLSQTKGSIGYLIESVKIDEEDVYIFLYQADEMKAKRGSVFYPKMKMGYAKVKDSEVYEQNIDDAYIIEYTVYTKNIISDFWRKLLLFNTEDGTSERKTYEIYGPKGIANDA